MMRTGLCTAFLALFLLGSPVSLTPTRADDKAKDAHGHAEHKDDPFKGNIDLSIWSMLVFLTLLFILTRLAWKPMLVGLEKREKAIQHAVEEAKLAKEEAARIRADLQKQMAEANDRVRAIIDEARSDAQKNADIMVAKAKGEIQSERDRLKREMEMAKDQALRELWSQSAQLATMISAKAIRRNLGEEDHRRLVDESIADLQHVKATGMEASLRL